VALVKIAVLNLQDYWEDSHALRRPPALGSPTALQKRSRAEMDAEYSETLHGLGVALQQHHLSARTRRGLANLGQEFATFLATSARPGRDTWQTCTDMDVLVFLQRHYLPNHEGQHGGAVAPSTLQKAVSLLSRLFAQEKRSGPWTVVRGTTTMLGNPTDSLDVKDFVQMHSEVSQSAGYLESSAVPLPAQHYEELMEGLSEYHNAVASWIAGNSPVAEAVLLARDAAAFACLWHSCRRGQDVLNLAWETRYAGGTEQPILASWRAQTNAGLPCQLPPYLMAIPRRTKTERTCRPQTLWLWRECQERVSYCTCYWLALLVATARRARAPCPWEGYISRGFSSRNFDVIGASALAQRFTQACTKHLLQGTMLGRTYSLHSFRRGRLQHEHAHGLSRDELMELAGLSSPEVLKRYLDKGRHL
jgi:hypothetical protein